MTLTVLNDNIRTGVKRGGAVGRLRSKWIRVRSGVSSVTQVVARTEGMRCRVALHATDQQEEVGCRDRFQASEGPHSRLRSGRWATVTWVDAKVLCE